MSLRMVTKQTKAVANLLFTKVLRKTFTAAAFLTDYQLIKT